LRKEVQKERRPSDQFPSPIVLVLHADANSAWVREDDEDEVPPPWTVVDEVDLRVSYCSDGSSHRINPRMVGEQGSLNYLAPRFASHEIEPGSKLGWWEQEVEVVVE